MYALNVTSADRMLSWGGIVPVSPALSSARFVKATKELSRDGKFPVGPEVSDRDTTLLLASHVTPVMLQAVMPELGPQEESLFGEPQLM